MHCDKAMDLLSRYNIPFMAVKIDEDPTARDFLVNAGHRAVPQLYMNGVLFVEGGYNGLVKMSQSDIEYKIDQNVIRLEVSN